MAPAGLWRTASLAPEYVKPLPRRLMEAYMLLSTRTSDSPRGDFMHHCTLRTAARSALHVLAFIAGGAFLAMGSVGIARAQSPQPVLQRGYNPSLTGANLTESALNVSNVNASTFGLLFTVPVDDFIYAQPLYVPNVAIANQGTHNVVYVATMSDTLYALDAESGDELWSLNLAALIPPPGAMPVPVAQFVYNGNQNITHNLGILSTPVIDPATNYLYLVTATLESNELVYRLWAVDIEDGSQPFGSTVIKGSYEGVQFDARNQTQRVSLALAGDQVVFGFGAVEAETDNNSYAGWVMGYDKGTLLQSGAFATLTTAATSTTAQGGGVWQSGRPPAVGSGGFVFVYVGNAYNSNSYDGVHNFSESALKLNPAAGMTLTDWFTPYNWGSLDGSDLDLASSGPLLIPGTHFVAGGGKAGEFYLLNQNHMGKYHTTSDAVVQEFSMGAFRGGPVYWNRTSSVGAPLLYNSSYNSYIKSYAFNGSSFASTPTDAGTQQFIWPGGTLALSASGSQHNTGIVWANVPTGSTSPNEQPTVPGALYAFNAEDLSQELWDSTGSGQGFGNYAKFVPPLVANGRVYMATFSSQVAVYGLLSSYALAPENLVFSTQPLNKKSAPQSITVTNTGTTPLVIKSVWLVSTGTDPFTKNNGCTSAVAPGAQCTIKVSFDPTQSGPAQATLKVTTGNSAGTHTVALSGTGGS